MQKRAYEQKYHVLFEPTAISEPQKTWCDEAAVALPFGEIPYLHYHDCLEIGLCCEGDGLFLSDDTAESVGQGDAVMIFPPSRHYSRSLDAMRPCFCRFAYLDYKGLLNTLLFSAADGVRPDVAAARGVRVRGIPPILRESEYPEAVAHLRRLVQVCFDDLPYREVLCAAMLCEFFLRAPGWFPEFRVEWQSSDGMPMREDDAVSAVAAYMSLHYAERLSVGLLAERCHLSESQLRRRFRRRYSVSPMTYLNQLRCHIGAELLRHTDMTVAAISEKVGYESSSDFYRHFTALVHQSPTDFRKQNT